MRMILTEIQWGVTMARKVVEAILGGWDGLLSALVMFMVVEYLTQILAVLHNKRTISEIGSWGMAKKLCIFFLVAMGNMIDALIIQNESMIRMAIIFFYLSHEGIRILENVAALEVPIPMKLKDVLEKLKDGKK